MESNKTKQTQYRNRLKHTEDKQVAARAGGGVKLGNSNKRHKLPVIIYINHWEVTYSMRNMVNKIVVTCMGTDLS